MDERKIKIMAIESFAERLKEEFDWTKVKDGSGSWSPGMVAIKIDKMVEDLKSN